MNPKRVRAYFYLLLVAAIWGIAGPVIKYTLPEFPPFIFLTYRFFLTCLVLIPITFLKGQKMPRSKRQIIMLTLTGLMGSSINLGFLFYGYEFTTALDASLLSSTSPLFVVAASAIFLKEKVTKKERLGLIFSFLGTIIIVLQPLIERGFFAEKNILGNYLIILSNLTWVLYILLSKYELKKKVEPLFMTTFMFLVGFLSLLPFAIYQGGGFLALSAQIAGASINSHLGVIYMAILSGALAYFLYQKGQQFIEASEATVFTYLSPIFTAPLAVFWLKEDITITYLLGGLVIAIGVYLAEIKSKS